MEYPAIVRVVRDVPLALGDAVATGVFLVGLMVIFAFVIRFRFLEVHELYGGGDDATPIERLTNCASCGARISVEAERCEYCGEPIDR